MQVSLLDAYAQECEGISSENQITVLLRDIEHRHTLSNLEVFARDLALGLTQSKWREAESFWLEKFHEKISSMPNQYRTDLVLRNSDDVFSYYSSSEKPSNALLVCFTGAFGGMMLPNWVVLSLLPETITHVLVIDSKRNLQSSSHVRFKNEWVSIAAKYQEILLESNVKDQNVFGVSGGTPAALLFAVEQGIATVMVVGPIKLNAAAFLKINKQAANQLFAERQQSTTVHFLSGTRDFPALKQIPRLFRLFSKIRVRLVGKSGHSVLAVLFRQQRLTEAFRWMNK